MKSDSAQALTPETGERKGTTRRLTAPDALENVQRWAGEEREGTLHRHKQGLNLANISDRQVHGCGENGVKSLMIRRCGRINLAATLLCRPWNERLVGGLRCRRRLLVAARGRRSRGSTLLRCGCAGDSRRNTTPARRQHEQQGIREHQASKCSAHHCHYTRCPNGKFVISRRETCHPSGWRPGRSGTGRDDLPGYPSDAGLSPPTRGMDCPCRYWLWPGARAG